ncbi:MAG TPA: hypothetical protein VGQ57_07960, partial [Polyangiaceae bacterium]|nr:hypothetical protein [Polyangiaceae bacterium]
SPVVTAAPRPAAPPAARPAPASAPPEPSVRCALSGRAEFARDTPIQSADGHAIARFTGGELAVTVSELTLAERPRAHLETGSGRGSFRVRGFVSAAALPVVTTQALPIIARHLWIAEQRSVSIQGVAGEKVRVEHAAAPPLTGTYSAVTTCAALSLAPATPPGWSPPGDARGYVLRQGTLELFDAPQGTSVGMLRKAPDQDAVLFFSTEQNGGFVHLERHADLGVDAWARTAALAPLPRGETMDQLAPPASARTTARFALPGEPRVVRTSREVPLRANARDADAPIGSIAPDTETYVVDVMAGWASVLPRSLELMGPEGGQIWAKKSDLGL